MSSPPTPLACSAPATIGEPVPVKFTVADASDRVCNGAVALLDQGIWSDVTHQHPEHGVDAGHPTRTTRSDGPHRCLHTARRGAAAGRSSWRVTPTPVDRHM